MYSHCKKTSITYYIQKLNEYINFTTGVLHCDDCDRFLIDNKDRVVILYGALHTYYEKIGVLIPERITEIREDLGLNKKEFGEYLSISQGMVHKYENYKAAYTKEFVEKVKDIVKNWEILEDEFGELVL